jgi:hypothetical protein
MKKPLKEPDEPIPHPRPGESRPEEVPGSGGREAEAEEITETNLEHGELPGDGQVLPTPMEQEQDLDAASEGGAESINPTETPEEKANEIINSGIRYL